jgi:hypothetical protein
MCLLICVKLEVLLDFLVALLSQAISSRSIDNGRPVSFLTATKIA